MGIYFILSFPFHLILYFSCTCCDYSPDKYNDPEVIEAGTEMNRSYANSMEVLQIY